MRGRRLMIVAITVASVVSGQNRARACPFCSAVSQTFSEEIESMDVVAIAQLVSSVSPPTLDAADPNAEVPKSRFLVKEVLKGDKWARPGEFIETLYFGDAAASKPFVIMGVDAPNVMWSTPLVLSEQGREYLKKLGGLPKDYQRLAFFQEYLEDEDEMLARDAYDEFAKAPYEDLIANKEKLHHDRLLAWINDPQVPSNRRRLYFTMLGVCGVPDDAELLETLMRSKDRKQRAGLDALIACYLLLRPQQGLDVVDELFLQNQDAEYADTYAAIMAIRFHGSQVDVIPKQRLVESLRLMLDRPELADLVIPDLAKWQDWDVMPRLVQLFRDADENSSWVRVPVINYLRVCPRPEAKRHIEELAKIDAEAVKRANTFFPLGAGEGESGTEENATPDAAAPAPPPDAEPAPTSGSHLNIDQPATVTRYVTTAAGLATSAAASSTPEAGGSTLERPKSEPGADPRQAESAAGIPTTMAQTELLVQSGPNRWLPLGVTMVAAVLLLFSFRVILGTRALRSFP